MLGAPIREDLFWIQNGIEANTNIYVGFQIHIAKFFILIGMKPQQMFQLVTTADAWRRPGKEYVMAILIKRIEGNKGHVCYFTYFCSPGLWYSLLEATP